MKRNPQNIHHVHHRQNDILYNKQLPLMNEVIGTKRPRKYENIYQFNYWKKASAKFNIAHRSKCGRADTLPAQQILNR